MESQGGTNPDGDHCVETATYRSHDGSERSIELIDAIAPLKSFVPENRTILLSKEPIFEQWPLSVQEEEERSRKKRRIFRDENDRQLEDLKDLLDLDIPDALVSLRKKTHLSSWLTRDEVSRPYKVATIDQNSTTSWAALESLHSKDKLNEAVGEIFVASEDITCEVHYLLHRLVSNTGDQLRKISLPTHTITLPRRSAFLVTDLLWSQSAPPSGWSHIMEHAAIHSPSLILLDPPYPNLSAGRLSKQASKYSPVTDLYDLWKLKDPVSKLLDSVKDCNEALVGCWVTNHAKIQRFVLQKLFPAWGLKHIGQLVWIKVTAEDGLCKKGGNLIYPLHNKQGRKPYEILFLGQRQPKFAQGIHTDLFASVPLEHSRKPYIVDLLRKHLDSKSPINVYEFFARSTFGGPEPNGSWVSMGNEPFKFNQEGIGY